MHVRASTPCEGGQSTVVGPAGDATTLTEVTRLHLHWFLPIADRMRTLR